MKSKAQLIVALDVETFEEARTLVDKLGDSVKIYKIGSQLFTAFGPVVVRHLLALGKDVFLDLKFHDIPNTVANAVASAVSLGSPVYDAVDKNKQKVQITEGLLLCTLHIVGGEEMLKMAAASAAKKSKELGIRRTKLVGITVLTSDANQSNVRELVLQRAQLAKECGLDGVVASCEEAESIRKKFGEDFVIVTPGIRPEGSDAGDQKRIATPAQAVKSGSNYLVVGRPIVKAADPKKAAQEILKQIQSA